MIKLKDVERGNCHDCNAAVGEHHLPGCDTERCPKCGGQLLSCGCFTIYNGEDECFFDEDEFDKYERDIWTGVMFEEVCVICEERGWYSKMVVGQGWVPCSEDDEGASHNLNKGVINVMQNWVPRLKK